MTGTDELRALLAAATPGPWVQHYGFNNAGMPTAFFVIPAHNDGATVEMLADDAALIVALRNAAPALLDERDALRAQVAALTARAEKAEGDTARTAMLCIAESQQRDKERGRANAAEARAEALGKALLRLVAAERSGGTSDEIAEAVSAACVEADAALAGGAVGP